MSIVVAAGCWSDETLVDGAFTPDEWAKLQTLRLPAPPDGCKQAGITAPAACAAAVELAAQLFVDRSLSGGLCKKANTTTCWSDTDCMKVMPGDTCQIGRATACVDCHDPMNAFIDSRSMNTVSQGPVKWTQRNSMTLLDIAYKPMFAPASNPHVYTWVGKADTAGAVAKVAITGTPMSSSTAGVVSVVEGNGMYFQLYEAAFGTSVEFGHIQQAFTAYFATMPQFFTSETPLDWYLQGKNDALSDSAKRGLVVFAGKGTCIECHNGPLFSDLEFHNTGVAQKTMPFDTGRSTVTGQPEDDGKFLTGTLREIASTGPYMHDGSKPTLGAVIDFYRQGGDPAGMFPGTRDDRIQPLDLTDQDVTDLEAFLDALTQCDGTTCPKGIGPVDGCGVGEAKCGTACVNIGFDSQNCGACGRICATPNSCEMGTCVPPPPPMCGSNQWACGTQCVDLQNDPNNCGNCGFVCPPMSLCSMGTCQPDPCPPGTLACPGGTPWKCVDASIDPMNCGSCGNACAPNQTCYMGTCQ